MALLMRIRETGGNAIRTHAIYPNIILRLLSIDAKKPKLRQQVTTAGIPRLPSSLGVGRYDET